MSARRNQIALCLAILGLLAGWFFVPLPAPRPLKTVEASRGPEPSSTVQDSLIRAERPSREMTFTLSADLERGGLSIELLDADGKQLCTWTPPALAGRWQDSVTFSIGQGFPAGGVYFLRVAERGLVGTYKIDIAQQSGVTVWQRFLVLSITLALTAAAVLLRFRGAKRRWPAPADGWPFRVAWFGCVPLLAVAYAGLHESGHGISMVLFGVSDWSRSDFLGIWGFPHGGFVVGAKLADWQESVVSISGPALPIFAAYLLFVLWVSAFGKRLRAKARILDALLTTLVALFLFSIVGLLLPAFGLVADSDYAGFAMHVHAPLWAVKLSVGLVACANLLLLIPLGRHLSAVHRETSRNPLRGASGPICASRP